MEGMWELAYADWKQGMKYQDIADKHGVSLSAVKSRAARDWKHREVATTEKRLQPKPKKVATEKKARAQPASVDHLLAASVDENEELTARQKDFCLYYNRIKNAIQAYLKAYGCSYRTAHVESSGLLAKPSIKAELARLREITIASLDELCGEDIVAMHMKIAFADITDYVEFRGKSAPILHKGEPVTMKHPKTGEVMPVMKIVNTVKLKDSANVDGQIIAEVSEGREGAKIKLADRQKSLDFLARYFELNPMDRHRKEYDNNRIELELLRLESAQQMQPDDEQGSSSNFMEALTNAVDDVWGEDADGGANENGEE